MDRCIGLTCQYLKLHGVKMLDWLGRIIFVCALLWGGTYLISKTSKPWDVIESRPLVEQMGICAFLNLRTGADNYIEALNVLGLTRPGLEDAIDIVFHGLPKFGRRFDCFANLSEKERQNVLSSAEYAAYLFEVRRQMNQLVKHSGGF